VKSVLIACDSAAVRDEVKAVLGSREFTVREIVSGHDVLSSVAADVPDLVICDMQLGSKGGMANTLDLRLEASAGRLPHVGVLLLLDRRADVFLARRSEADGFLVKPLDPIRLRTAVAAVLAGGSYEDPSYRPAVSAASPSVPLG
jgi:DNA-binding NarL/FixJ family response regulator